MAIREDGRDHRVAWSRTPSDWKGYCNIYGSVAAKEKPMKVVPDRPAVMQ
jgi:hypothetical protein